MLTAAENKILPKSDDHAGVTAYLQQLRTDLLATRAENPGFALDAFNLYFEESERLGRSLTALPEHSPDEGVRFFARVVHGTNGHAYWTGGKDFRGNVGNLVAPRRWWWRKEVGELSRDVLIKPGCGQPHCIAPGHQLTSRRGDQQKYSEEEMLGKLQTVALRLGHPPSRADWIALEVKPSEKAYAYRFGGWTKALVRAGLQPNWREYSAEDCMRAIRYIRSKVGHWPSEDEFLAHKKELMAKAMPASMDPMIRLFGRYTAAREAAKHLTDAPILAR